ncbi:hypothetical protein M9Y10_029481 [Tritrichomonas musculus]|uniref:C2 domain-containing protein n=1 Tax=Tritrichomonas musculus TaxID=1915356 RepID=A0ABR2KMX2_9EUKA
MSCSLHVKIIEAKKLIKKSDLFVSLQLKSQGNVEIKKTLVIVDTKNPKWNQEFDFIASDPNDILRINMYEEGIDHDIKVMDELKFPVSTWEAGGPIDHQELSIKHKKKKAGKFIFEVQSFPLESPKRQKRCKIKINVIDAKNILRMDAGSSADPYMKFCLESNKKFSVKTQVLEDTLNPKWNQLLEIVSDDRETDVLTVDMFDEDIMNDTKMMDTIKIPLKDHPINSHYTFNKNINLKSKPAGLLHFELDFIQIDGNIIENSATSIKEARNNENDKKHEFDDEKHKFDDESSKAEFNIKVKGSRLKLLTNTIKQVPLDNYPKDFAFIINGQQFKTSKIIADLISPTISKIHRNDPTVSEFLINTKEAGNFQNVLDLITFRSNEIKQEEMEFIFEIFSTLGIDDSQIEIEIPEFTIDGVIELIKDQEHLSSFFSTNLTREIKYLSEHFYELTEEQKDQISQFSTDTIERVVCNDNLQLECEDQLLKFINKLYIENKDFSYMYEYVSFSNVGFEAMDEFMQFFDFSNLTAGSWFALSKRLHCSKNELKVKNRYRRKIPFSQSNLNGIFDYLQRNSKIDEEVKVKTLHENGGYLYKVIKIDNTSNIHLPDNSDYPCICFEFSNHRIIPSHYTIRSNDPNLKSWIIEGSEDEINWMIIDEQKNCSFLNYPNCLRTFEIKKRENNEKKLKFIRIRNNNNAFGVDIYINSIEFYGLLIN